MQSTVLVGGSSSIDMRSCGKNLARWRRRPVETGLAQVPVLSFSLENSFGHFASEKRSSESECFITDEGLEWLRRPDRFYFLCPLHGRVSPQHFRDLLQIIDERPGIPVEIVVDLACSKRFRTSVNEIHWTLARLFKYGLVMSPEGLCQPRP